MRHIEALPEYDHYISEYGISLCDCDCLCFEAGETVIKQGSNGEFLYFIVEGSAQVQVYSPDGKVLSLSYSVSEGALGEVELIRDIKNATASVISETKLICLAYPYHKARMKCKENILFINRIAKDLAEKLSRSTESFLSASFASAESRICVYLLRETSGAVYRGTLAKAALATGISYRHLQRVMIHLCRDNVLEKKDDGYHILDFAELEKRAFYEK